MKKFYILFTVLTLGTAVSGAYTHRLASEVSMLGEDKYEYFYDDSNRLDSATQFYVVESEYDCYTLYTYDDRGNMIQEDGYQKFINDDVYTNNTVLKYTYDDQNRLKTRTNYNLWDGNLLLGGVYEYVYDENDLLVQRNLYIDEEMETLYEKTYYTNDENGRCTAEEVYSVGFSGNESQTSSTEYAYDDEGRLQQKTLYQVNWGSMQKEPYRSELFVYDEDGNMSEWIQYITTPEAPTKREIFKHNELKTKDVVYPWTPEYDSTVSDYSVNAVEADTIYAADMFGNFGLYDIVEYEYTTTPSAVDRIEADAQVSVRAFMGGDNTLYLKNIDENSPVRIYDMSGRLVKNERYTDGGITIGDLRNGVYCISTENGAVKILRD